MKASLTRDYKLKFYLNAQHFITINGSKGETHPHTWEFCLIIRVPKQGMTPFEQFEKPIEEFLKPFQNQVLNDMEPFDARMPTLENIVDVFAVDFCRIAYEFGGVLQSVEGSEGPTRGYIVTIGYDDDPLASNPAFKESVSQVIGSILDEITGETGQ